MPRIIATLILFTSLLSNVTQSAADTGVCDFGSEFSFNKTHNCKNGDTAFFIFQPSYLSDPAHFKAHICDLDKKVIEGLITDDQVCNEEGYIICTFLKMIVRE